MARRCRAPGPVASCACPAAAARRPPLLQVLRRACPQEAVVFLTTLDKLELMGLVILAVEYRLWRRRAMAKPAAEEPDEKEE